MIEALKTDKKEKKTNGETPSLEIGDWSTVNNRGSLSDPPFFCEILSRFRTKVGICRSILAYPWIERSNSERLKKKIFFFFRSIFSSYIFLWIFSLFHLWANFGRILPLWLTPHLFEKKVYSSGYNGQSIGWKMLRQPWIERPISIRWKNKKIIFFIIIFSTYISF